MANSTESGKDPGTSRREFLKNTGRIAATSALAAGLGSSVYAAGSSEIKIVLIGCGGRGRGAASNALSVKGAASNGGPQRQRSEFVEIIRIGNNSAFHRIRPPSVH